MKMISKHGRMKMYCRDDLSKIENYEQAINDKENMWVCHHRLELTLDGEEALSQKDLMRMNMYYHRPYFELIFIKDIDHRKLHARFLNDWITEESLNKIREKRKGTVVNEETRKKISKTVKQRWKEGVYNTNKTPRSEFGIKFKEHFGITNKEDPKLYNREKAYYRNHNHKCRWEM